MELSRSLDVQKGSSLNCRGFHCTERNVLMEGARQHVDDSSKAEKGRPCLCLVYARDTTVNRLSCINMESVALQEVNFVAGEVLGSGGAEGECIYLIAQGQVDVLRSTVSSSVSEVADADDDIADEPPCQYLLTLQLWYLWKTHCNLMSCLHTQDNFALYLNFTTTRFMAAKPSPAYLYCFPMSKPWPKSQQVLCFGQG